MCMCEICHFSVDLDDIALRRLSGWCVCLRCYLREAEVNHPLPKALRQEIEACLAALPETAPKRMEGNETEAM
jgi:hypothetical protein